MKTKYTIIGCLMLALSSIGFAQKSEFAILYKMGFPTGNFKDYSDEASFLGFDFKMDFEVADQFFLGVKVGGQNLSSFADRSLYSFNDAAGENIISATRTTYTVLYPLMAHAMYEYLVADKIYVYGGLGIGMNFVINGVYYGDIEDGWVNNTAFAISPEAGVKIGLNKDNSVLLNLGANWDYSVYDQLGLKNISVVNVFAGLSFKY